MADVTEFLASLKGVAANTCADLLPVVYDELKRLAAARLAQERKGHTLTATSLVHEAYLRLAEHDLGRRWNDRHHFFAVAAEAMRRVLVDNARRKGALKRGGGFERQDLEDFHVTFNGPDDQLLNLNDAVEKLEQSHPRKAALVKLRYFAGLTIVDAAEALGVSRATAQADWSYARAWLKVELTKQS
jgi:RNA polymerase sigma factor (TIGR02999 family)